MSWIRICGVGDIDDRRARSFTVEGTEILVLRLGAGYLAIPHVCVYAPRFLAGGGFEACFDGTAPLCDRHPEDAIGPGTEHPGISAAPIFAFATRVADGCVYVDAQRQELSSFERITCAPVVEAGEVRALRLSLWSKDGEEHRDVVYALPT